MSRDKTRSPCVEMPLVGKRPRIQQHQLDDNPAFSGQKKTQNQEKNAAERQGFGC